MPPPSKEDLWNSGRDETVEVNQRALIDSQYYFKDVEQGLTCVCVLQKSWRDTRANIRVSFYPAPSRPGLTTTQSSESSCRMQMTQA